MQKGPLHFAIEVDPFAYETHKLEIKLKWIMIIGEVIWESGQESFYFNNPEGNVLEIVPVGIWN